jgi:hypothetical protein
MLGQQENQGSPVAKAAPASTSKTRPAALALAVLRLEAEARGGMQIFVKTLTGEQRTACPAPLVARRHCAQLLALAQDHA